MTEDGVLYRPSGERQQLLVFSRAPRTKSGLEIGSAWTDHIQQVLPLYESYNCMQHSIVVSSDAFLYARRHSNVR